MVVHLINFPWAGGTSALFKEWEDTNSQSSVANAFNNEIMNLKVSTGHSLENGTSSFRIHSVNYPGRLLRQGDPRLTNMSLLADTLVCEILSIIKIKDQAKSCQKKRDRIEECQHTRQKEEIITSNMPVAKDDLVDHHRRHIVLFGHSFGAIVAFEVAQRLEARQCSVLALFVSASRPPSALSLVSSNVPISEMSIKEMQNYFKNRGNAIDLNILANSEMAELFLDSTRLDYRCLESYEAHNGTVQCPIFAFGGELDPGVSKDHVKNWGTHTSSCDQNAFNFEIFQSQGK